MAEATASGWSLAGEPETAVRAPSADGVRWACVLPVVIGFFLAFHVIEHEPETFAGRQIGDAKESRIVDEYIDSIEGGNSLRQVAITLYGVVGFALLVTHRSRPVDIRWGGVVLLGSLFLWALASAAWSDEPALAAKRLAVAVLMTVGSLGFARLLKPNELLAVALVSLAVFAAYSLACDLRAGGKPWGANYRFGGTLHPNIQAAYCSLLCLAAFSFPAGLAGKWVTRGLFAFGFVLLVLTQSRTSVLALAVGVLMVFVIRLSPVVRWWAVLVMMSLIAIGAVALNSIGEGGRRQLEETILLGRTNDVSSLTGRVPLWQELTNYASDKPITGYGYETFWTPDRIDEVMRSQKWALQSAHNAYFEIVLQLGFVGLALAAGVLLASLNLNQAAYARTKHAGYAFIYGVLAFAMANSLLESHFAKLKYPTVIALIGVLSVMVFFPSDEETTDHPNREVAPA